MKNKRSVGITVLAGIFFGLALLPIWYLLFKMYVSWKQFFIGGTPWIIIYLSCGLIVINKWPRILLWQKGALVGIGIQGILLYLWMFIATYFLDVPLRGFMLWLFVRQDIIFCPFIELYRNVIFHTRAVLRNGVYVYSASLWETGLLFPLLRVLYAGIVGGIVGKIIEKLLHSPKIKE